MRRHSPNFSPPRRGYGGGRPRSPPRGRFGGGYGGRREPNTSLLVRNIPRDCREAREPRGFGFVQFVDPSDAAEAQYQMDGQYIGGREITVVLAEENRKRPEEMRTRTRAPRGYGRPRSPHYRRSRSRSRSPDYRSSSHRSRHYSRSYTPEPRRGHDYSRSPLDKHRRSPSVSPDKGRGPSPARRSHSPLRSRDERAVSMDNGHRDTVRRSVSSQRLSHSPIAPRRRRDSNSPRSRSRSPSGSRSRSFD